MGKLAVASAIAGASAVVLVGAYYLGAFGGNNDKGEQSIGDEANPTLKQQLVRDGYTGNPIGVPQEDITPSNNKFTWKNWDCLTRLFPELSITIKHDESNSTTNPVRVNVENSGRQIIYLDKPSDITDDFITCALLDLREGSAEGSSINKKYFKSEVVFKDKDYGGVMGNGLSFTQQNIVTFEYRLLTFKKDGNIWKIDRGFGGNSSSEGESENVSIDKLTITLPQGQTGTTLTSSGNGYSMRKIWSGIAKMDESGLTHLVNSLNIYIKPESGTDSQRAEFFGNSGNGSEVSGVGYQQVNKTYSTANGGEGWKILGENIQLGDSLKHGYQPFKNKKVSGTTCDQGSEDRKPKESITSSVDEAIRNLCYGRPAIGQINP